MNATLRKFFSCVPDGDRQAFLRRREQLREWRSLMLGENEHEWLAFLAAEGLLLR